MTATPIPNAPTALLAHIAPWTDAARCALWDCRTIFHRVVADRGLGRLDETLKWSQPSWRPVRPRTGSTLRLGWDATTPHRLSIFVDCKTDLAARLRDIYPGLAFNDGRRHIGIDLGQPLPRQAIAHLAEMTFTYHLARRRMAS